MQIYHYGTGAESSGWTTYFYSPLGDVDAEGGLNLAIYSGSSPSETAVVYGWRGTAFTPALPAPAVSGAGTGTSPYVMVSRYTAGTCPGSPCLAITESVTYVTGENDAQVTYDIANQSDDNAAVRFRATVGADVRPGGDEGGKGVSQATAPRQVGTVNYHRGNAVRLEEIATSPWDRVMEANQFEIWRRVQKPLGDGLTDTVDTNYTDKAAAAQWDSYRTTGLAGAATATIEASWTFTSFKALEVTSPPSSGPTGIPVSSTVTAKNEDASLADLSTSPVRWAITGATDVPAVVGTYNPVVTTGPGTGTLEFTPQNPGYHYLEVWQDIPPLDGVRQPFEPLRGWDYYYSQYYFDQLDVNCSCFGGVYAGGNPYLTFSLLDTDGSELNAFPFTWSVTGANPVPETGGFTEAFGATTIPHTGLNPGTDTVTVKADFTQDGDTNDFGEVRTQTITWRPRLDAYAYSGERTQGQTDTVYLDLVDANGYPVSGAALRYRVVGANPADWATTTPTSYGYTSFSVTGANVGTDTITVYYDVNGDHATDPQPDPGEPQATVVIDWLQAGVDRLASTSGGTETIGGQASITLTLRNHTGGSADGTIYHRRTGRNPLGYTAVATSGGQATVSWSDTGTADTYDYVDAFADLNGNTVQDENEPTAFAFVGWDPKIRLTGPTEVTLGPVGNRGSTSVNLTLRELDGDTLPSHAYDWQIVSGPNAGSVQSDTTGASGFDAITWPGTSPGTDVLRVTATIDGQQVQAEYSIAWRDRLRVSGSTSPETGTTVSLVPTLFGQATADRVYNWSRSGVNGTASGSATAASNGIAPAITWTGSAGLGTDTLTLWTETNGTPGEQASDEHTSVTITWVQDILSLVAAPTDMAEDATKAITARLRTPEGLAVVNEVIRYSISGANSQPGKLAKDTDGQGEISFSWTGNNQGSDYVAVYADTNRDGNWDSATEPRETVTINWRNRIQVQLADSSAYQGETQTANVTFRDVNYQGTPSADLKYRVVRDSGGQIVLPATPLPVNSSGEGSFAWLGEEGELYERVEVWEDTDGDNVRDGAERQNVQYVYWNPQVRLTGNTSSAATGDSRTINAEVRNTAGAAVASAPVSYVITGANPSSGSATTDTSGVAAITWTGTNSGNDTLLAWRDLNGDGDRDDGEPRDTVTVPWYNEVTLTPTSTSKWVGETQQVSVSVGGPQAAGPVRWRVEGANPQSETTFSYDGSGTDPMTTLTGANAGTDYVYAYRDLNANNARDAGEPGSGAWVTWYSVLEVTVPAGSRTAGQAAPATATATLYAGTGTPGPSAPVSPGQQLEYRVTGANPQSAQSATTDANGQIQFSWNGVNSGTDTAQVFRDTNGNDVADGGETVATTTVVWNVPPVSISLTPATQTRYEDNTQQFTATVSGITIPGGGVPVYWSVSGVNPASGSGNSDNAGVFQFTVSGAEPGTDTVSVFADLSGTLGGVNDNFDPDDSSTMIWLPLVSIDPNVDRDREVGDTHSETIRLLDTNGNPVANTSVLYEIEGANATGGVLARPVASMARVLTSAQQISARTTDGNGDVTISWTGTNSGTDTLTVYGDTNNNGAVDPSEPRARTSVTWAARPSGGASANDSFTAPVANPSQTTPGGGVDIDGLPTPPPPVTARSVNLEPVSGVVLVRLPGSSRFVPITDAEQVPVGTVVDVSKGRVELTSTKDLRGGTQRAEFYLGMFQIGQKKTKKPVTDLALFGGNFKGCGKPARGGASRAKAAAKKNRVVRRLWGSGKGQFRTRGRYAAAALRGTDWETADRCDGTLVRVTKGRVAVTDLVRRRTVIVRAGRQYFAARRR